MTVSGDQSENNAFFMFLGEGTSCRDNTPGQFLPMAACTRHFGLFRSRILLFAQGSGVGSFHSIP